MSRGRMIMFICGPMHGHPVPDIAWEMNPPAISVLMPGGPVAYLRNFWNTRPPDGFYYYAYSRADDEEILAAISRELEPR